MDIDPKRNYRELAAKAKAVKEPSGDSKELTEQVQHKNELQFKASHGLLVGFLLWIWLVSFAQSSYIL